MNIDTLKAAYEQDEVVRAICDHMASRDRNQNETLRHRISHHLEMEGKDFAPSDIIAAFRKLEEAECGKYVEGRRGWKSRFVWSVKSRNVASFANGDFDAILATGRPVSEVAETEDEDETEVEMIEHSYVLRTDLSISLELPADLSSYESSRLAKFIESLPLENDE